MGRTPAYRREREELAAVLRHGPIRRAPSLAKILSYVCERHFEGKTHEIKEFNIAVDALGRRTTFEPSQDSIVRVEAHHLRRRLHEYYETAGKDHPVKLRLAETGYAPRFDYDNKILQCGAAEQSTAGAATGGENAQGAESPAERTSERETGSPAGQVRLWLTRRHRWAWLLTLAVATGVAVSAVLWNIPGTWSAGAVDAGRQSAIASSSRAGGAFADDAVVRLNCGALEADWIDSAGNVWLSDRYFSGGTAIQKPDARIKGTLDQDIYRTAREGDFEYIIPLPPGVYELHLHFSEIVHGMEYSDTDGTGHRRFSVTLNGEPLLRDFDIVLQAGGTGAAEEKVFTGVSPAEDGRLHLGFSVFAHRALVSGIEVLPGAAGKIRPVRIVMNTRPYYDGSGQLWTPDRYFAGGRVSSRWGDVTESDEPGLYASERWGQFSYAIPVVEGEYTVRLMFAESNFGVTNIGTEQYEGACPGSRVFDVYSSGTTLLEDFDVCHEAGGPDRAVVKTFRKVRPNGSGKLLLSFMPVKDYPTVRAIEVLPESD